MQRFGMMTRVIAVALGVVIAVAALASVSAQQEPPHRYYGTGATPGDEIAAVVSHGDHYDTVGSATVGDDGSWYIDVDRDMADEVEFTLNGEHAEAAVTPQGAGQSSVVLTVVMMEDPAVDCPDDSMMEDDDSMMEDDDSMMEDGDSMAEDCPDDSMMDEGDDSMMDDDDSMLDEDDSMMEDDDSMMDGEDVGYPDTGTGGLADNGGVSAGLIGLLIALGVAAVAGLGLRRVRNRA